jgi:hypothetical protein
MSYDAKERATWKVRLTSWLDRLPPLVSRPTRKLMGEVIFGVLASGSLRQSEIARALKEPGRLHHTQKRLSRMLRRHSEVAWAAETLQLQEMGKRVHDEMILAIDPGDLNRDGARYSEYRGRVRDGDEVVRFGITQVRLRAHPEHRLSMVVVRHGQRAPLVLVSTQSVRGRRQGERLMQAYLDRWACEDGYRFSKQGFALEGVTARRFATLQNLVALASLAWALLAAYQRHAHTLWEKARRQKPRQRPVFPFYSLLAGWQRLFAAARRIFYHWWRRPIRPPSAPPIDDLFASTSALMPTTT